MTLFVNKGGPVKIRIGGVRDCHWTTIKQGEVVDLPARAGISYGFSVKTTEGQIGSKKVETKQIQNTFLEELKKIKGIGKKTAQDITKIFPVREELIKTIRASTDANALPIKDDLAIALYKRYSSS